EVSRQGAKVAKKERQEIGSFLCVRLCALGAFACNFFERPLPTDCPGPYRGPDHCPRSFGRSLPVLLFQNSSSSSAPGGSRSSGISNIPYSLMAMRRLGLSLISSSVALREWLPANMSSIAWSALVAGQDCAQ